MGLRRVGPSNRRSLGTGPFTPGSIGSQLSAWYAPDSIVSGGANMSAWNDKSGNGLHINLTAGTMPSYAATGNPVGGPSISGNGTTQSAYSAGSMSAQPVDIFVVANWASTTAGTLIEAHSNNQRIFNSTTTLELFSGTASITGSGAAVMGAWHIYDAYFNGASSFLNAGGAQILTGNPGTTNGTNIEILAFSAAVGPSGWATASMCEIIIASNLSAAQRASVYAYLNTKYGVT